MVREELFAGLCSKNSSPNVRSGYGSARQGPDRELLFPNFLCKFDAAYRCCRCVESLETDHRSNPLFDAAMILESMQSCGVLKLRQVTETDA